MTTSAETNLHAIVRDAIAAKFRTMRGFARQPLRLDVGLDTPLSVDAEAVTGFTNRDRPATAVYVWLGGVRWAYDGRRWTRS